MFQIITTSYFKLLSKVILSDDEWHSKIAEIDSIHLFDDKNVLVSYFNNQYKLNNEVITNLTNELDSNSFFYTLTHNLNQNFEFHPTGLNILSLNNKLIFWKEWDFIFKQDDENYFLWTHRAGIADYYFEIKLSDDEKSSYLSKGIIYIQQLADKIRNYNSDEHKNAVKENRVIFSG